MERLLGAGSEGEVYRCLDLVCGRQVAIKTVAADNRRRLLGEYETLVQLRHPNLVQVLDLGIEDNRLFLVEEVAPGNDFLTWARAQGDPISICRAWAAAVRGVEYLHSCGLVHRDLKPDNVRVGPEPIGRLPGVRLVDFGLAARPGAGDMAGTLGYVAPEVLSGEAAGPPADIYGLGALLFEVLFHQLPNPELSPSWEIRIPEPSAGSPRQRSILRELLGDVLHRSPERRPAAGRLLQELSEVVAEPLQIDPEELRTTYFPHPPFVGRDQQIRELSAVLDGLYDGQAAAFLLQGCGKSAFARVARQLALLRGIEVRSVDNLARLLPQGCRSPEATPRMLAASIVDGWTEAARQRPLLIDLDGCSGAEALAPELLDQYRQAASNGLLERCLLLWSEPLPAGLASAAFWQALRLEPLGEEQAAEIVRQMLYHCAPPDWEPELLRVSGGDPRWLVEIVLAQVEAGVTDRLVPLATPETVSDERLASLAPDTHRLLSLLACARSSLPLAALERRPGDLARLNELVSRGLVDIVPSGCRIGGLCLQRSLEQSLTEAQSRLLHAELAELWRDAAPDDLARQAHHLLHAGALEAAVEALVAEPLAEEGDLQLADQRLSPQAAPRLWAQLQERLASRQRAAGDLPAALARAARVGSLDAAAGQLLAAELLHAGGQPVTALEILRKLGAPSSRRYLIEARAAFSIGDYPAAAEAARRGRELLSQETSLSEQWSTLATLELANLAALAAIYRGNEEEGLAELRAATLRAEHLGALEPLARLLNSEGIALQRLGRLTEALSAYERSAQQARRLGDLRLAATVTLNIGTISHRTAKLAEALAAYQHAYQLATRADAGVTRVSALANQGNLLLLFGDFEGAQRLLQQAEKLSEEFGNRSMRGHLLLYRAELELVTDHLEASARTLTEARQCFEDGDRAGVDAADLLESELAVKRRLPEAAVRLTRSLLSRMGADDPDRFRAHLCLGRALFEQGRGEGRDGHSLIAQASRQIQLALALAEAIQTVDRTWECLALLAQSYRALGMSADADHHSERLRCALDRLRESIPVAFRPQFDQRPEIVEARQSALPGEIPQQPAAESLRRLLAINKELNQRLPLELLLQRILDGAIEFTGAERAFVILRRAEELRVAASRNVDGDSIRRGLEKFSRSIADTVIRERRVILSADAMSEKSFAKRLSVQGLKLRAVLCVPLGDCQTIEGALYVDNRFRSGAFDQRHVELLTAYGNQAAIALYNASLLHDATCDRDALARAKSELELVNGRLESLLARQSQQLNEVSERLRSDELELVRRFAASNIIGRSKSIQTLFVQMDRVADTDLPVFIFGESGTGKELVARAIHNTSRRREQPFISVNCAAIPNSLLESELFGHVRGAFTGAVQDRTGLFEAAGAGTLLLDEIGDMSPEMQVKLLRILQENTFRRIGSTQERASRCRVLSASHCSLTELVARGVFREDLFFRLNVFQLNVPPLRERRLDIPLIVTHLLQRFGRAQEVSQAAMAALIDFDWPGNVRQLENELQKAGVLADAVIDLPHLSDALRPTGRGRTRRPAEVRTLDLAVADCERQVIGEALRRNAHNITKAAKELGIHRVALHKKMRRLGIDRPGG